MRSKASTAAGLQRAARLRHQQRDQRRRCRCSRRSRSRPNRRTRRSRSSSGASSLATVARANVEHLGQLVRRDRTFPTTASRRASASSNPASGRQLPGGVLARAWPCRSAPAPCPACDRRRTCWPGPPVARAARPAALLATFADRQHRGHDLVQILGRDRAEHGGRHEAIVGEAQRQLAQGLAGPRRLSTRPAYRPAATGPAGRHRRPGARIVSPSCGASARCASAQPHGVATHARRARSCKDLAISSGASPPSNSNVHSACTRHVGRLDSAASLRERPDGRLVAAPHEHLLDHVALPAAGAVERGDQPGGRELVEPRDRARRPADRKHAVDAAHVAAGPQVELLLHVQRNPLGMLDRLAIHVGDPQRAVGPGGQHRRAGTSCRSRPGTRCRFSSSARRLAKVSPSGRSTSRCTRLCTGSLTNALPAKAGPNRSSR